MNIKKPKILFGSVAQPGLAFGYGTIGENIIKYFNELQIEVVNQARLLLGNFRSHEAIRRSVIKEGSMINEN